MRAGVFPLVTTASLVPRPRGRPGNEATTTTYYNCHLYVMYTGIN